MSRLGKAPVLSSDKPWSVDRDGRGLAGGGAPTSGVVLPCRLSIVEASLASC